jgi:hypothetical protein
MEKNQVLEEWSAFIPDAPGQLRLQPGRRVQGVLPGRGEDCPGKEVVSLAGIPDSFAKMAHVV